MQKGTVADLFRNRFVTCLTLKIMYLWFFASMGYYFLAWGSIPGNSRVRVGFRVGFRVRNIFIFLGFRGFEVDSL